MRFGIVGLGRMGGNLARLALDHGQEVVGFDPDPDLREELTAEGVEPAATLQDLAHALPRPRVVLVYVPHGPPTEEVCVALGDALDGDDVVVDGGNSHWEDSQRRHADFARWAMRFLDVGTSGGVSGARNGACFMVGGEREAYTVVEPLLMHLAADAHAVLYVGGPGSGHFTKLIHNAIEFGIVQSIAEGVEMLERSEFELDLPALLENWNHGSVIRSWLVELMRDALLEQPDLDELSTYVEDTGEVKWVLEWALRGDIPSPVVSASQQALMGYRDLDWPAAKAVALLRHQFGGHPVHHLGEHLTPRR
jgi:6-phosphogluconate dehydrogenase